MTTTSTKPTSSTKRRQSSLGAQVSVSILRTAAVLERFYNHVVAQHGITIQQYDVLRILRSAGAKGLPTLTIRDRMIHEAPGITRLIDRLEQAGYARRVRTSPDRRQVLCQIASQGTALLAHLDAAMAEADAEAVSHLTVTQQRELLRLLQEVRSGRPNS